MKLAGSSGAGQELKSRFAMPVLRFCSGAVLLLAGLYGALLCFFQTFALPEAETALIWSLPTTLLFLIIYSLPKHRGLAYLAVFVLWGIAAFFVMREVVTGAVFVAEQFSTQASAVFPKLGHFAPPQAQEDLAACRMFFRVVQFPLTGYLAWAVVKAHSFFFSLLATAPFLAIAAVVGLVPPAFALVLLIGFWAAMLLSGRAGRMGERHAAKAGLLLAPFAFLLAALVVLFQPPDAYQPSTRAVQVRNAVIQVVTELFDSSHQDSLSFTGYGAPMTGSPGMTDLTNAGELRFTDQTMLRVQSAPADYYLRGWAGSVYTGTSWQVISEESYQGMRLSFQPLLYTDISVRRMGGKKPQASGITIDNIGANRSYTYTPYYLSQGDTVTGSDFKQDAYLLMGREDGTSVSSYTLHSYFTPLSAAQQKRIPSRIRQMEREYEALINKRDTQLPDGVRDRLLAYAEKAGLTAAEGPEDWLRVARAAAQVVQNAGTYTEKPGAAPEGQDFVLYFLEESPRGYCIHFASAAAVLMRALNVPARYVEGYTVKTSNFKADGSAEIPDRQAHAWVEVWADGQGWTPIEATPGGAATLRENPDENDVRPDETTRRPTEAPTTNGSVAQTGVKTSHWPLPLLAGLCVLALVAARLELTRRRKLAFRQKDRNRAAIAVYRYLCRLARFGYMVSGEAQRLARKAKFSRHVLTREELSTLQAEAEQAGKSTYEKLPLWKKLLFRIWIY